MIRITHSIQIPEDELDFSFIAGGGPGGQKVNKTASTVQLRFDVKGSESLPACVKKRLLAMHDRRVGADGVVMLESGRTRSQRLNREDAVERLCDLLRRAAQPPKRRRPTRVPNSQRRQRLENKRKQGEKKQRRQSLD
jgi:ribosome-associated protein